jgi:hypothetical protein
MLCFLTRTAQNCETLGAIVPDTRSIKHIDVKTFKPYSLFFIVATLFMGCARDTCETETQQWKRDAKEVLCEFKTVNDEIKNHHGIFRKEEFATARLFLRTDDSVRFENKYGIELPKLKKWFKKSDWGFISYDNEIITVNYKTCNSGNRSYSAYLYYSQTGIRPTFTKNLIAEIKDSISLGDNWYFIRTKCTGCDD